MPFNIVQGDITRFKGDAIVNAANTGLRIGGGVCGAIFDAAGADELQAACDRLAPIRTGDAVITPGFALPAKYIIHAAGPMYDDNDPEQSEKQLRAAYINALTRAVGNGCKSIAFPLISSGIYGYPKEEAIKIAASSIQSFPEIYNINVILVVYDTDTLELCKLLLGDTVDIG